MNKEEKAAEVKKLKISCEPAKTRLLEIRSKLQEIGANREAKSLEVIICKLEYWENK